MTWLDCLIDRSLGGCGCDVLMSCGGADAPKGVLD